MNRIHSSSYRVAAAVALSLVVTAGAVVAAAGVSGEIGPYRVRIVTAPGVIPVGKAKLRIDVTDAAGKPVEGAMIRSLVKMPSMSMGEKETPAEPIGGKPGSYAVEAAFAMAGGYEAALQINGPLGEASGKVAMETGQNTEAAESPGFPIQALKVRLIIALLLLGAVFVLYRLRKTGQRIAWRSLFSGGTIGGVLLLVIAAVASRYAIDHWRRPGAMTPVEAQGMEMNIPAPPGAVPVSLADVTSGPIENTVQYSGQAIAFNEQDVIARTQGVLDWMPFYTGQGVKADEPVARLDISLLHAHLGQSEAAVNMASESVKVSERGHLQALAEIDRVRAELRGKSDAIAVADAEIAAAREERSSAEAAVASRQTMIADAKAMLVAMESDAQFWQQQNTRNKTLLDKGALSTEEYQREAAMAANASAKVQQSQARLAQAEAEVRSAQAMVRKAEALLTGAEKKRQQTASEVAASEAAVRSTEAMADVSMARIGEAQAGVSQARSSLAVTTVTHSYAEIRAPLKGVVTERLIGPGQLVNPGQAILKIAQTDPIRLQANVAEIDLARIKPGYRLVVRGQGENRSPVVAKVTSIAPTVDPATRTAIVEALVPNPDGRFRPGQFIALEISIGESREALRVPLSAIHTQAQTGRGVLAGGMTKYVWLAEEGGSKGLYRVKPVEVTTGVSDGLNVQILSGVDAGQKVVASGAEYLNRGDTVSAVPEKQVAR